MSNLSFTVSKIDEILTEVERGDYASISNLATIQNKANQNETDIESINTIVESLSGLATQVVHTVEGVLSIDLGTSRQVPISMQANVSQLNLTNGVVGRSYTLQILSDNTVKSFALAPALNESDNAGIYNASDVVTHPNGRVYKAATGTSGLRGEDFQADLSAGSWKLYVRTQNDDGYFPSQNDEDLLHIECIGTDYFKVTPHYGS